MHAGITASLERDEGPPPPDYSRAYVTTVDEKTGEKHVYDLDNPDDRDKLQKVLKKNKELEHACMNGWRAYIRRRRSKICLRKA
jgi:hypothetical protein